VARCLVLRRARRAVRSQKVLLAVDISGGIVADYEWVWEEPWRKHREFLVPAAVVNSAKNRGAQLFVDNLD
jgi:hypothetical protein